MSGSLGDLTVRFTGDASQLAATISEVQGSLSGLEGVSGKAAKGLQGLGSVSSKNLEQVAKQTRAQGGLKSILDKTSKSLEEKKTKLAEVEKAYNENKPKIEANIRSLKDERSSIDDSIKASRDKIATLREQNAALKSNSKEYRSNIATIQNTTQGIYDQQQKRNDLTAQIQRQQSALKKEEAAYRSAESAVKTASAQYQTLAGSQKEIVRMERALKLEETGEKWQKIGDSVNTITKPFQVVATGLAAGGVAAAKFAIDFEDNFANVEKTVDGTPEQLEEVRQGIIDLTTTGIDGRNAIPQTTAQLTELAAAGGQLGIETENILEFTETMAQMGTATNLAGEEGAKTLARFMNVTGTSQDQVKNLGSAIVELGNNFATSESEIASLAMRMGSTGSVVGISAQDILGYSTALSSLGMEAEAGGSAVSRIWMDMQSAVASGGETLTEFAKVSGKSSEEFAAQWKKDASGAFLDFLTGLSKSEDQVKALSDLGFNNIYDIQALQRLASQEGIGLVTEALQRSNTAWEENIALQEEFDAKADTTASQIQITKNNLVEAGRSIGEAFLPIITDVSSDISDFAQGIANMSDEGKESLINTAVGLAGVGAAAKVVTGTVKDVGDFVEALGKIGTVVPALASAGPAALAVAAGITAVTGAVVLGTAAYNAYHDAQLDTVKVTDDQIQATKESLAEYKKIKDYQAQAQQLETIIKTSTDTAEIEEAKQKLDELKARVEDEYNVDITVNDGNLDNTLDKLGDVAKSDLLNNRTQSQEQINDSNFSKAADNLRKYNSQLEESEDFAKRYKEAMDEANVKMSEYGAASKDLEKSYESGAVTSEEYIKKQDELTQSYADAIEEIYKEKGVLENLQQTPFFDAENLFSNPDIVKSNFEAAQEEANNARENFKRAEEEVTQFKNAIETVADATSTLVPDQLANGEFEEAMSGINTSLLNVKEYSENMGFDDFATDIVGQLTVAQQGFNDISQVAQGGDAAIGNFFRDFVENAQAAGASTDDMASSLANMGQSLVQNGANADTVSSIINNLEALPEEKTIKISAEGDVSIIDQTTQRIEEIQGESVTVRVNAEGNLETITEAGNEVTELDGRAATVTINAEGNYEVVDEVGNRLAVIDGQTGTISIVSGDTSGIEAAEESNDNPPQDQNATTNITAGDTSGVEAAEEANSNPPQNHDATTNITAGDTSGIDAAQESNSNPPQDQNATVTYDTNTSAPDSYQPADKTANAVYGVNSSAVDSYQPPDKSATVTYTVVVEGEAPLAKGTKNFSGGLAMINDQPGISDPRELVQIGGKGYIFEGKDVIVPLPEHAKVYTASQTKQMMAASGIPRYASGKNNEDWENAKSDREHIRKVAYRIIDPREELEWLEEMKKKFASDAEVIKEIEEQVVEYTREMWASDLENMQYALDMGWQSEEEYYRALAEYRDQNFAPDTQEYKDATLKLHKYSVQLIEDADELSEAYIDLHGRLNDWGEMGTSMGAVWQTVNKRNVQAAKDGLITWDEYFEKREGRTEQFLDNYIDYSDDWIKHEQDYNAMGADDTIAAINRQRAEVERYFAEIGELTDEEYALKAEILAELDDKSMDAALDKVNEWRDDADWYKRQADVYGWDFLHDDSETDYWRRVIDREMENYQNAALSMNARQEALRKADEARLELYQATEDEYDEMLDMAQDRIDETEKALSDRLSALDESWEVEDRAAEKAEVLADLDKYKNAVTIEGRDKYEELQDQLKEIEREEQRYAMEQENNAILEQLEAEYEALENEKAKVLQQVRDANLNVAALIEPLEENITNSMNTLGDKIAASIDRIRPSVTFTQNNTNYINDGTDGLLYQNRVFNQSVGFLGG